MQFRYTATKLNGEVVEGRVEADNSGEVLAFLASKDLKPISISKAKGNRIRGRQIYIGKAITAVDKIFLAKHLSLMLRLGTDLFKALDILIADAEKPALRSLLEEIKQTLEKGQPFYVTFARYPKYFSPVFVNLIKAGEASGNLETTFDNLSEMLSKQEDLKRKIRSALIYPMLLLVGSFGVLVFLITFALPRIADVFLEGGLEIPTFSKIVFVVGLFLSNYIWYLAIAAAILLSLSFYFFSKVPSGKKVFAGILSRIPVIGKVVQRVAIQRFAMTLASLMKAGVPILDALEITATSVGNSQLEEALKRIAREGVARGLTLGDAFKKESAFPVAISSLVAISEKAGHLDEVLTTLSTFYESEIESAIKALVSFIEPVLLIFIGAVVLLIALSIIVPIYQLIGQF